MGAVKKCRLPWKWEEWMVKAYDCGNLTRQDYLDAIVRISQMQEGRFPEAEYGPEDSILVHDKATGRLTPQEVRKPKVATFIHSKAPGGYTFWSRIMDAISKTQNPQYHDTDKV